MRRLRSLGCAALLATCVAAPAAFGTEPLLGKHIDNPATDAKVRLLIERSRQAFDKGELLVAITEAKTAVFIAPVSAAARLQLGICLMQAGDAYNAEDQLRRARFDGASDVQVLPHLFEAMLTRGEYDQLLDEFPDPGIQSEGPNAAQILRARAVALQAIDKPQDANASMDRSLALLHDRKSIIIRANIALQQSDAKLAKSLSDEVLAANPKDAESLDLRVRVALAARDMNVALQTANALVDLNPKSLNSRLTRIGVYFAADMDDRAKSEIELVNKQFSNLSIAAYYRAVFLARKGDVVGAWKIGMLLPEDFNVSNPEIGGNVAEMAAQSGHLEPAAAILHAVITKWPHDLDARLDLAAIRLKQRNATDALSALQPMEETKDPLVAMYFARAYTMLHRPQDARRYLDIIKATGGAAVNVRMTPQRAADLLDGWVQNYPNDLNARRQYAQLLMQLGQHAKAEAQFELILKSAPDDVSALNDLGWLVQKSDPRRAVDLVSKAQKLAPGSASVLDTLGWIEYGQGDKQSALPALQRAHEMSPANPTIACHLAEVLVSFARGDEAKPILAAALKSTAANFDGRADAERLLATMH